MCRLYSPVYTASSQINIPPILIKESKTKLTSHAVLTNFQPRLINFELYFVKKNQSMTVKCLVYFLLEVKIHLPNRVSDL